jgi:2-isopropylmalate synthase
VSELTNIPPQPRQPYVGVSAFAHKAGLHASAIRVDPNLYQHIDPLIVGNDMRMLVSEMAGRASIELKSRELGFDLAGKNEALGHITQRIKEAEAQGYTYDAADASFELVLREEIGERPSFFSIESWQTSSMSLPEYSGLLMTEATVKLHVGGERIVAIGEGNGPVDALDHALRAALAERYPAIQRIVLDDYKVRILESQRGTDAITRVLIEFSDGMRTWRTVGVAENVIEASWEALIDSLDYGLIHAGTRPLV